MKGNDIRVPFVFVVRTLLLYYLRFDSKSNVFVDAKCFAAVTTKFQAPNQLTPLLIAAASNVFSPKLHGKNKGNFFLDIFTLKIP